MPHLSGKIRKALDQVCDARNNKDQRLMLARFEELDFLLGLVLVGEDWAECVEGEISLQHRRRRQDRAREMKQHLQTVTTGRPAR